VRKAIVLAAATLLLLPALLPAQPAGDSRLLRYPDIHGDEIVFVYGGDLWVVEAAGGTARRLTSHPGLELFPKFSPDGKWIAFSGEYGGNRQVFVIGAQGGAPRQLTFHNDVGELPPRGGYDNQVMGWTPDGKEVLFRAARVPWSDRISRPYLVPAAGGMEHPLAVPESATGMLSPDGKKYVYAPISRDFRTWKRHRGGRAQDVWIYDLEHDTSDRLTDQPSNENHPVWIGNIVYFTSDREHTLNLYAFDLATRQTKKVTHHDTYDVLWPSSGDGKRIVYECGGALYVFDPASATTRQVPVRVLGDFKDTLPYVKNVRSDAQTATLSPTGKRALFSARGELFTVPSQEGEIRNLTRTPGVREKDPAWSPDGRFVAYLSDKSGEYEVYVRRADGTGEERRVTTDGDAGGVWLFPPRWSPDSKRIAFGDKRHRLRYVAVEGGAVIDADSSTRGDITDYRWSPDGRWLAYTQVEASQLPSIYVYSLDRGKPFRLTGELTGEAEPVFDPQGRYLYFVSNRDYNFTQSGYEFDYVYINPARVYVGILAADGPALFLPTSDEETPVEEAAPARTTPSARPALEPKEPRGSRKNAGPVGDAEKTGGAGAAPAPAAPPRVHIDVEGFEERVRAIPGPSGNYRSLAANADGVFYLAGDGGQTQLRMFNLAEKKEQVIVDGALAFELSADGKKVLYRSGETYGIVDAKPGQRVGDGRLALDHLQLEIHPREEWAEMYLDAWRILRDWYYDAGMNGADWKAMRDRYGALLPYASTRDDVDFLLGELGAEISSSHVYVERGDQPGRPPRVEGGLLGAEIEADPSGYFRIAKIFPGENWQPDFRSPLTEPGIRAKTGDLILAVDGVSTKGVDNFYRLLQAKANRVVTLLVNSAPRREGAHEERVRTIANEQNLRYFDWVKRNRDWVDQASGGRVGYIHLPDTATAGNRELFKYFYPQATKEGLIVDDRYNNGGFIPDMMTGLLNRKLLNYWVQRGLDLITTPTFVHTGPKVCLINGPAGSGGDAFPYYFRKLGLGPLIGTRTWGGLIGVGDTPSLLDGGVLTAPETRFLTTEGTWDIENVGVYPDIEVLDRPEAFAKGRDPSLEKGLEVVLEALKKNPPQKVVAPPPPKQKD
jgi:tricorn protease